MDSNEKLKYGVLKALQGASPETGMKLSSAIKQAGQIPDRKTKDQVRKFLNTYARQYPKQLYYLSDGEKVYPGDVKKVIKWFNSLRKNNLLEDSTKTHIKNNSSKH